MNDISADKMKDLEDCERCEYDQSNSVSNVEVDVAITRIVEPSGPDHNERLTATKHENRKRKRGKHRHKKEEREDIKEVIEEGKIKERRVNYDKEDLPEEDVSYNWTGQELGQSNCTLLSLNNMMKRILLTEEDLNGAGERLSAGAESKGYNASGFYQTPTKRKPKGGNWSINCIASALRRKYGDQISLQAVDDAEEVLHQPGRYLVSILSNSGAGHMIGVETMADKSHYWYDPLLRIQTLAASNLKPYFYGGKAKYLTKGGKTITAHFQGMYRAWRVVEAV